MRRRERYRGDDGGAGLCCLFGADLLRELVNLQKESVLAQN